MKPAPFDYVAPESVDEALALLAQHSDEAKILAGGQSLVATMNFRLAQPALLIDINGLEELSYIREEELGLRIGALTRQRQVERSEAVARRSPLLHQAMPWVAHAAIRNRGTFGGSLAHCDPASELPAVALALEAELVARSAAGQRTFAARDFFLGLFETALEPDEILVEARIPDQPPGTGAAFLEMSRRRGDFALVGVAVLVNLKEDRGAESRVERCRIALFSVADHAVLASHAMASLKGRAAGDEAIRAAAAAAANDDIDPNGDLHASAQYRRHLAEVLVRRALCQAVNDAEQRRTSGPAV